MSNDQRLREDPRWIAGKRFGNDLLNLLRRYPEGAPDRVGAQALMVLEEEVEGLYRAAVDRLRRLLGSL